tara:strand:- start:41 stop:469 length:429 start_codon:yes stop_codon:yes gene_type:complete
MQGFIVNDNATTEIVTTYGNGVLLHEDSAIDAKSKAMPQACYLSHLDISLTNANSAATVSCFITWDSGKDHPMTGEATGQKLQAGSTGNLKHVSISLDAVVTAPTAQTTAGKCYLWVIVDDATGSPEVATARLHWADSKAGN